MIYVGLWSPRSLCIPAVHLVTSVLYPSVCMHVTTREPLSRFSSNFILEITLISRRTTRVSERNSTVTRQVKGAKIFQKPRSYLQIPSARRMT